MHLILNNIIFSQQTAGGISLLWSEIIKYIINKNIKCLFVFLRNFGSQKSAAADCHFFAKKVLIYCNAWLNTINIFCLG